MSSKERILARRAQFVAAALAATTLGCARKEGADIVAPAEGDRPKKDAGTPEIAPLPCLNVEPVSPMVCLTMFPPSDAGPPPKTAPIVDASPGPAPAPCLDVPPP